MEGLSSPTGNCSVGWYCLLAAITSQPMGSLLNNNTSDCSCPNANLTGGQCWPGSYCPSGSGYPQVHPHPTPPLSLYYPATPLFAPLSVNIPSLHPYLYYTSPYLYYPSPYLYYTSPYLYHPFPYLYLPSLYLYYPFPSLYHPSPLSTTPPLYDAIPPLLLPNLLHYQSCDAGSYCETVGLTLPTGLCTPGQ